MKFLYPYLIKKETLLHYQPSKINIIRDNYKLIDKFSNQLTLTLATQRDRNKTFAWKEKSDKKYRDENVQGGEDVNMIGQSLIRSVKASIFSNLYSLFSICFLLFNLLNEEMHIRPILTQTCGLDRHYRIASNFSYPQ